MKVLIVTRHTGAVEWLKQRGIEGEVVSHVDQNREQLWNTIIYGNVPLHIAAKAYAVVSIDMPRLSPEKRGVDLTPEEMDLAGANMNVYYVAKIDCKNFDPEEIWQEISFHIEHGGHDE